MPWAYYERTEHDATGAKTGEVITVVLPDNPDDRAKYEDKDGVVGHEFGTFKYVGPAPAPGMEDNVPDAVVHGRAMTEAAKRARAAEAEHDEVQARRARVERKNTRAADEAADRAADGALDQPGPPAPDPSARTHDEETHPTRSMTTPASAPAPAKPADKPGDKK